MDVQLTVNSVDLKRSFRRLVMRLDHESSSGCEFVVFKAGIHRLEMRTVTSSEELLADVSQSGAATVPVSVFWALAQAMRFDPGRQVNFRFSSGHIVVNRNVIRHLGINSY